MQKTWQVKPGGTIKINNPEQIIDTLLQQRGIIDTEKQSFLEPRYKHHIHDPYLFAEMDKAVNRILAAVEQKESILIYGDYDVDGITSTAIITKIITELGGNVAPFIPDRNSTGYGLNKDILAEMIDSFNLLITVDCGISNFEEIKWLKNQGKDIIVTDHHVIPDKLPPADAIIHTRHPESKYPFDHLCGAAVAWKLAAALLKKNQADGDDYEKRTKEMLDLVCLGTIADMMPLNGENRVIVKEGLRQMKNSKNMGIRSLIRSLGANSEISTESISFKIAPLLNAAGRIAHAQPALDLLTEENHDLSAKYLGELVELNNERRRQGRSIQQAAENSCGEDLGNILLAVNMEWQVGVVGLVAGKLCEKFGKPAFVIGGTGDLAVGSVRGPKGTNVLDMLKSGKKHLLRFGGHDRAAGFTLEQEKIDALKNSLIKNTDKIKIKQKDEDIEQADLIISQKNINLSLIDDHLRKLEPFGQENEQPKFIIQNIYLADWRKVGQTKEHVKTTFKINDEPFDGIGFSMAKDMENKEIKPGQMIDVLGYLEINNFNGWRTQQIRIVDIAKSGTVNIKTLPN